MQRTQIYLGAKEQMLLRRVSKETGLGKSQLIRQAIERTYLLGPTLAESVKLLRQSAGAWASRGSGSAYVNKLRGGRLQRFHAAAK